MNILKDLKLLHVKVSLHDKRSLRAKVSFCAKVTLSFT